MPISPDAAAGPKSIRIGIDLGGTKIEAIAMNRLDNVVAGPLRQATPRNNYRATLQTIVGLAHQIREQLSIPHSACSLGVAMPGSIAKQSGCVQNANSTWLNGRPFASDLAEIYGGPVRYANDANCFALSEAIDGAARDARIVFGVIIGTGCGGGLVIDGKLIDGPLGISGEWGHNPLPWPQEDELPGTPCWCGRSGCMETWVSGPAITEHHKRITGRRLAAQEIAARAADGDVACRTSLTRHADRLARGLAHVANIIDPEVIVLGGGLSNLKDLYRDLPGLIAPHLFSSEAEIDVRPPKWGDSSGVRGAAWLWP